MDADIYWNDKLIGHLHDVLVDQPYYLGTWTPIENEEFRTAFQELQHRIAPNGLGMLPVTFRSPDGALSAPVAAMVEPDRSEPYFRFCSDGAEAQVLIEPRPR